MQSPQDQNSPSANVVEDITQVKLHVLAEDHYATWTNSEALKVDDQLIMVKCSNEKMYCDGMFHQPLENYMVRLFKDEESSEDEEPTEFVLKDKGLLIFLKAVSALAIAMIAFSLAIFALGFYSMGCFVTYKLQERILAVLVAFIPFSVITVGLVSIEGRAKDIDLATTMVLTEIAYAFFALCLAAMFIGNAPWFTVVPLFLVVWSFVAYCLVSRYGRPRCIYEILKKMTQ